MVSDACRQFAADTLGKSTQIESSIVAWCTMKTPYDVLGISPDADEKTIAIAFREAAKRCHPDLNPGDHAAERFKQISAARDALSNAAWRTLYQYVQLKRQDDRRQWIVTIASCIISAVVSAGLVSFMQKPPMSDPPIIAATLSAEVESGQHQFPGADVARRENGEPLQSVVIQKEASRLQEAQNETARSDQDRGRVDFPVVDMAQWVPQQALATLEEDVQKREGAPTASKEHPLNGCRERLENRSEPPDSHRCLKARNRSEHNSTRNSSGRHETTRNSHAMHKLHRRFTDRRSLSNHSWLSKRGGSYLRHTTDAAM